MPEQSGKMGPFNRNIIIKGVRVLKNGAKVGKIAYKITYTPKKIGYK